MSSTVPPGHLRGLADYGSSSLHVIPHHEPVEVAAGRQSETSIDDLYRRRQVVRGMDFGDGCDHVEIDASATPDIVLLNVKRAIWERL